MASVKLNGDTSGFTILSAQPVALNNTLTLPNVTDTLVTQNGSTLNSPILNNPQLGSSLNFATVGTAPANGVFLPVANQLALATNSTERLRIDVNGNVGIATTVITAGYKLQVQGNVYTSASMSAAAGWAGTGSSAGLLAGIPMQLVTERSSIGSVSQLMSMGNGSTTQGVRMPFAGKIYAGTLDGTAINGTVTVQVAVNGSGNSSYQLSVTGSTTTVGATGNWLAAPLSFNAGDNINYITTVVPSAATGFVATLWYVFS